jgi:hypothetical protein
MIKRVLGSHNSLSSYPLKSWWFAIGACFGKCQSLDLVQQYVAGVRVFDLRLSKHGDTWYGTHGLMVYKVTLDAAISTLAGLASKEDPIYFRVLCENEFYKSNAGQLAVAVSQAMSGKDKESLRLTFVGSKEPWYTVFEGSAVHDVSWFDFGWDCQVWKIKDFKKRLTDLQTTGQGIRVVGCYSSKFLRRIFTYIMRKFIDEHEWGVNEVPFVDFVK